MGKSWAEGFEPARAAFQEADASLGFPLSRLCWEGPSDELQLTANTQPAILATSIAILRSLPTGVTAPVVMAGHSLGEYSALVACGCLGFSDALRLVRVRGQLMQDAVPVGEGAMAAILGFDETEVAHVAAAAAGNEACTIANLNAPEQTVIAGHRAAVERAVVLAKEAGARRAIMLPVSAPFHSSLMEPARRALEPHLEAADWHDPGVPVVTNVDARPVSTAAAARLALIRQVDAPVRWVESVQWMVEEMNVDIFVEIGPGRVLAGLIRRISPGVRTVSLVEPKALDKLMGLIEAQP